MAHTEETQSDFGTGQKKLNIYIYGLIICSILTLIAFGAVMVGQFSKIQLLIIIYAAAIAQFFVQLVFFLRLNVQTEPGRLNVMSIIFTLVILISVVAGSLWIMQGLNYNMMN